MGTDLEDDIAAAAAAVGDDDADDADEIAQRLARWDDARAVDALLDMAHLQPYGGDAASYAALIASPYRDLTTRFLAKVDAWIDAEDDAKLYWTLRAVATRRDPALVACARRLATRWEDQIDERAAIAACLMCGDAEATTALRTTWREHRYLDKIVEDLVWNCPGAASDVLIPIVRDYQRGDDALEAIARAVSRSCEGRERYEGHDKVHTPVPLDAEWFALGLELVLDRPRPGVNPEPMLAVPHPRRVELVREASAVAPASRQIAELAARRSADTPSHALRTDRGVRIAADDPKTTAAILDELGEPAERVELAFGVMSASERAAWVRSSCLARAEALSFDKLGATGLDALLASPHVAGITRLALTTTDVGQKGLAKLAASDAMPMLAHLELGDGKRTDDTAVAALTSARGATLSGLESLELVGWSLRDGAALGESELARGLTHLSLREQMRLGKAAHEILHALGPTARLASLDLSACYRNLREGSGSWAKAGKRPISPIPTLKKLVFRDNAVDARLLAAIVDAWWWPLDTLILGDIHPDTLAPLRTAPPGLRHLDLANSSAISARDLRTWSSWPAFEAIETLVVTGRNDLRASDLQVLPPAFQRAIRNGGWPD